MLKLRRSQAQPSAPARRVVVLLALRPIGLLDYRLCGSTLSDGRVSLLVSVRAESSRSVKYARVTAPRAGWFSCSICTAGYDAKRYPKRSQLNNLPSSNESHEPHATRSHDASQFTVMLEHLVCNIYSYSADKQQIANSTAFSEISCCENRGSRRLISRATKLTKTHYSSEIIILIIFECNMHNKQ